MHEELQAHIEKLEDQDIRELMQNLTTHALLSALLTGHELEEHEMMELMHDHITEIITQ